jgi:two-component system phosphate regulon sensor histidine kinase PhoR
MSKDVGHLFNQVLLVEDDSGHALLIRRALKDYVGQIAHVETVKAALEAAQNVTPALIISDLNLPDSGGPGERRLAHVAQLLQAYPQVPIIVLTSSTAIDDAVEAMRLGAKDFLVKNFDADFKSLLGMSLSRVATAEFLARESRRLQAEMAALRLAIENGEDGFALLNAEGAVMYCNNAFQSFATFCGGNATRVHEVFGERVQKRAQLLASIEKALAQTKIGTTFSTELLHQDHANRAFEIHISVVGGERQTATFVVWVKDTSEQKRREKFQREILSTTTHDLKGPLGAIVISSELLGDLVSEPGKARELVLRIASSAQGAINLIDEFLSARRIQEGNFILRPTKQNMLALVEEGVEGQRAIAQARKIELGIVASKGEPHVLIDRMGFLRVLGNLLSNALKFTPKDGRVQVEVELGAEEVHVRVRDSGPGMEPSEVQKVFQRFSRLEKHREVAGTGLGLFVVKSIVSAHGGQVSIESQLGAGTVFDVALPRNPPVNERGELICLDFI